MLTALVLALALDAAPTKPPAPAPAPPAEAPAAVTETAAPEVPAVEAKLAKSQESRTEVIQQAEVAEQLTRGSFWWYVAIIVVAGVLLAVLTS